MDDIDGFTAKELQTTDNSLYASNFGASVGRYYDYALSSAGTSYGNAKVNDVSVTQQSYYTQSNDEFAKLDKENGANNLFVVVNGVATAWNVISKFGSKIANIFTKTKEVAEKSVEVVAKQEIKNQVLENVVGETQEGEKAEEKVSTETDEKAQVEPAQNSSVVSTTPTPTPDGNGGDESDENKQNGDKNNLQEINNVDKNAKNKWHKGSFDTAEDSLNYHFKKHGKEVGAESVEQYARKAEAFSKNLKGATKKYISGSVEGVVRYYKNGLYVDKVGDKIISFGKRGF